VVTDPAPSPEAEMRRTYEWMKGWGLVEGAGSADELVDMEIQQLAHTSSS
jgi:hypothetical protein